MVRWCLERLLSARNTAGVGDVEGGRAGGRGSVDGSACGQRRDAVAATPGRRRSDGGTPAPPGAVAGAGGWLRELPPVTNFAKPEISDRGRDAVRGAMFGGGPAHYRLVTERPGVW